MIFISKIRKGDEWLFPLKRGYWGSVKFDRQAYRSNVPKPERASLKKKGTL